MALSVMAVSISVSPFCIDEDDTFMFMTSAPSRLPASSKELCVRVEASKNRLISVRPRRTSRFLMIWRLFSAALSARSSSAPISPDDNSSHVSRCRRTKEPLAMGWIIKAGRYIPTLPSCKRHPWDRHFAGLMRQGISGVRGGLGVARLAGEFWE